MGIEREQTALSIESIPKSIAGAQMEPTAEAANSENLEPPERRVSLKPAEKNGNLGIRSTTRSTIVEMTLWHNLIRNAFVCSFRSEMRND
jgi:hypothetical protein